ncbi:MAG TPA: 2-dehydropantoate 2-reductase [Burkholderiales bacterium]|nr:2-dehydropantoate 2-reductase [Burkholderiales bacterium]
MKICVFGAGAVGGHMAAKLAAKGHDVSVVARGAHLEAILRNGLKLLHGKQTIIGRVRAAEKARELGAQDAVFVTLKANSLGTFADQCAPLLRKDTAVVFVQNGIPWWYDRSLTRLDPDGRLARAVPMEQVVGGVAYSANELIEPGVIENHVPGNNMFPIGRADRVETPLIQSLRKALEEADMSSPALADIRQSIWSKAAQMLGNSTLCTLTGLPVGAVLGDPVLKEIAAKAGAEGRAIAAARGVDVSAAPQRPSGGHASGAQSHKPSILQDYERGRAMEVETQLMAPLLLARAAKVHTPTLDVLVPLVAAKASAKGLYSH